MWRGCMSLQNDILLHTIIVIMGIIISYIGLNRNVRHLRKHPQSTLWELSPNDHYRHN